MVIIVDTDKCPEYIAGEGTSAWSWTWTGTCSIEAC